MSNNDGLNNPDGIRRYEQLTEDIRKTADEALAIAIANSVFGSNAILDIAHGGTGFPTKSFVDTYSNQFEIHGAKIFHDSCGFQKESDIVDSGELAGNVRLIICDEQAKDLGPQLRFSGRHTTGDPTGFAYATIAGRKSNSISGDKGGYLQFATTTGGKEITDKNQGSFDLGGGEITEGARLDEEQNFGIGTTIPIKGLRNRLWISGGDLFIDNIHGERSIKLQLNHNVLGRLQAKAGGVSGSLGSAITEGVDALMFLSNNVFFHVNPGCVIDDPTKGDAAIELDAVAQGPGTISFLIGEVGACPMIRGQFHHQGLDVAGNVLATGNVTAGGFLNEENGSGNANIALPGFIGGDNIHIGTGDPNNKVNAPIGAIYGRRDAPTENLVLYAKSSDDYGPTGWTHIPLQGLQSICVAALCPDPTECPIWFDTVNHMTWYWDPNAKAAGVGAWLSSQVFQLNQRVPTGELGGGIQVAEDFRGRVNKHYIYFTPSNIMRNRRHPSDKFDLYLQDLTTTLRVRNNGLDPVKNYYLFDIVTLVTRQGEPLSGAAKQEWPGDRAADDFTGDVSGDTPGSGDITGQGHTFHNLLSPSLIARTLPSSGGVVIWTGAVASVTNNRKLVYVAGSIVCLDVNENPTACDTPSIGNSQFQQNLHTDRPNKPFNSGYVIEITSGAAVGQRQMIFDNTASDSATPSITYRKDITGLNPGDTFKVYSKDYKRVITRVSTKGQVWFPNGPYANAKTKDIQDFIETAAFATAYNATDPSNPYPGGAGDHSIAIGLYIPLVDGGDGITPVDAAVLCGLWNAVGQPGMVAGSISLTYRLGLPNSGGVCA